MTAPIVDLLAQLEAPGTFATRLRVPAGGLDIAVKGVGALKFPITPRLAQKLRSVARPAPFGLREQTLHDASVRNTWEVVPSRVKVAARRWKPVLATSLRTIQRDLGLPDACEVEAVFDKLLLYEEGHFFQLLEACLARSPALKACVVGTVLHRECAAHLGAILRGPARSEGDWSITYVLGCACADCKELSRFLRSARADHDWPLARERRQHIHQTLDRARLPVLHTTLRRGSPHVLQLRKDPSLFSRERAYRARVKVILHALPAARSERASRSRSK